jgi:tetratricopeptide (TPR) repeat protein
MEPVMQVKVMVALMLTVLTGACIGQSTKPASSERDTAFALEQRGMNAEAEGAWRAVLKTHPADAEAYAHLGFLEARQEHYKEAVPLYHEALALNPTMPGLRLNLGLAQFKGGELRAAIETFAPLLKDESFGSPEAQRLNALMGLAHYGVGEYAAAVPYMKAAATNDPQNLQFRLVLAHSCLSSKQYQCVLDTYHEILTLNAESAEADMLAGEALDEMHNTAGAIEQFRAAVLADPKEPNVHFGLGYLLWTQNQFEEAAREFKAELVNVPESAQALAYLANAFMQTNRAGEAPPLIQKAIQIDPGLERAHLDLGVLAAAGGRRDDAIRELHLAVKLNPADPNPHWRLARLYQAIGKKEEASVEFQKTKTLHKDEAETIFSKLKAAQDKGKPVEEKVSPSANE